MHKILFLIILFTCISFAQSDTTQKYFQDRFAIGYEEGLAFRYRIKKGGLTGGVLYQVNNPTNRDRLPLHELNMRLGCFKEIIIFPRVRTSLYLEVMEKMTNVEFVQDSIYYRRYQIWSTNIRSGILLSCYLIKNIMISWKIGLEYSNYYYGQPQPKENINRKPSSEFGISNRGDTALKTVFNNFGFYIFF